MQQNGVMILAEMDGEIMNCNIILMDLNAISKQWHIKIIAKKVDFQEEPIHLQEWLQKIKQIGYTAD